MNLPASAVAFALISIFFVEEVMAQINGESIATYIAIDSGNPREDYLNYSYKLATTLKLLTPQQLERVFGSVVGVSLPYTLNEQLELGEMNFDGGSADLTRGALEELNKVAEFLAFNPKARISIEGHAWYQDDRSQALSEARATAAMNYLSEMGISPDRIETVGYGAARPLVESDDLSETIANRRVEIRVVEE
ncbi:MAG: OmpA family protein [Verrucomicrobiales bacterium]|nr:OmpA family protein [Verrucomicrobiales bacterium]